MTSTLFTRFTVETDKTTKLEQPYAMITLRHWSLMDMISAFELSSLTQWQCRI